MDEKEKIFPGEDTTKYGEFISSFHAWLPIEEQKNKVRDMEIMTEGNKDN